jgi:hypothetical protein
MTYQIEIYDNGSKEDLRFILGTKGTKTLFVIGINPSTANEAKPDLTIKRVMKLAENNSYDSFVMLNLYPQRTTNPSGLDLIPNANLEKENLDKICNLLKAYEGEKTILASWGETILIRRFLFSSLNAIVENLSAQRIEWKKIGEFTKSGHPRHPSRVPYKSDFIDFDITQYLKRNVI